MLFLFVPQESWDLQLRMFGYITGGFPRIFGYVLQVIKYSISVPLDRGGFGGWNLMLTRSYRPEVRPRSTGNEFPSRVIIKNYRRLQYGELSSNTICDLPTFKRRDCTRHVHYNMLYMWRIYCFHLNQGNFAKFFMAVSFTLVDLKFLV